MLHDFSPDFGAPPQPLHPTPPPQLVAALHALPPAMTAHVPLNGAIFSAAIYTTMLSTKTRKIIMRLWLFVYTTTAFWGLKPQTFENGFQCASF